MDLENTAEIFNRLGLTGDLPQWPATGGGSALTRSIVERQIDLYEFTMKQAPVAAFLRQQAMVIDFVLSALKTQKRLRTGRKNDKT